MTPGRTTTTLETGRFRRAVVIDLVELFALCGIGIAQPVLEVFGNAPEVFIEAGASRADIWWFAAVVAFGPPIALAAIEVTVRAVGGPRVGTTVHHVFVAGLALLIGVRAVRLLAGIEGSSLFVLAAVIATLLTIARYRFSAARSWLRFAAFAPLLFAGAFVFASPAKSLARGADAEAREAVEIEEVDLATPRPPVVLLVLDELPIRSLLAEDGTIDAETFPNFAALADDTTWFRNATTVATHTANAVPAILTGRYPGGVIDAPAAADHPDNLFRLLGNAYRFNVSELDTQLCAVPRCDAQNSDNAPTVTAVSPSTTIAAESNASTSSSPLGRLLGRVREEYPVMVALHDIQALPSVEHEDLVAIATTTTATTTTVAAPVDIASATPTTIDRGLAKLPTVQPGRFSEWLASIDSDTEHPQLNVLHLTMPHNPWNLDASGTRYRTPNDMLHLAGTDLGHWTADPGAVISARQRHLLQVRYVDTLIAALRARLVELGIWDEALVIVTADHGAGFEVGGWLREWDATNQTNLLGVPLFVRGPEFVPGAVVDQATQSVDIVPTIAAHAGIAIPWSVDGVDLNQLPNVERTRHPVGAIKYLDYNRIEVDVSTHLDSLLSLVASDGDDGGDDATILRRGPRGDLIGQPLSAFAIDGDAGGLDVLYPDDGSWAPTDTGSVSAFIVAEPDDIGPNEIIVISVDGTIGATAMTFRDGDVESRLAALILPTTMLGGDHDVRFFHLRDGDILAPLDAT